MPGQPIGEKLTNPAKCRLQGALGFASAMLSVVFLACAGADDGQGGGTDAVIMDPDAVDTGSGGATPGTSATSLPPPEPLANGGDTAMDPQEIEPDEPESGGLCSACESAEECDEGAACIRTGRDSLGFCGQACDASAACPAGFECADGREAGGQCVPTEGSCAGMPDEMGMPMSGEMPPMTPTVPIGPVNCGALGEWPEEWFQFENEVLLIVNMRRAEGANCGGQVMAPAEALNMNPLLTCAARGHSQDMAVRDFFDHENPDGESPADRVDETGYEWRNFGENIAFGQADPEQVMEGWMDSPGHCRNIMGSDFTEIGIGYYLAEDPESFRGGRPYWTQNFARPR